MTDRKDPNALGSYVMMILLNNKLYNNGRISEDMKNKISAEIVSEYQRGRTV